jgi:hypothetical protein
MLLARGVLVKAPGRLAASFADARVGIDTGGKAKLAGAFHVGIGSSHGRRSLSFRTHFNRAGGSFRILRPGPSSFFTTSVG